MTEKLDSIMPVEEEYDRKELHRGMVKARQERGRIRLLRQYKVNNKHEATKRITEDGMNYNDGY